MRINETELGGRDSEWVRSTTECQVPYYINHRLQCTQWDHPQMTQLTKSICKLNDVRFSAYRLAMKIRAIQKHLFMHIVDIASLVSVFEENSLGYCEEILCVEKMTKAIRGIFELLHDDHPKLFDIQLCVDLVLNWILNVYDQSRNGQVRTLSFKVLLVLMCKAHLEEKYRYIFRLVADSSGRVDERNFALLLHDCQQIPKALGELAAFGGSNIEPSVQSCFKKLQNGRHHVTVNEFLDWLKQEPQSLVWLPVLHRLSAAESASHQAKCNICKQYPIIGFRYRCLRCFNFDMCQNCFFAGRTAKHHKLSHPMNEYCTTTTSGEDVKDFTQVVKNKLRPKHYFKKHPRLGYLPVQTVREGDQIETPSPTPCHWSTTTFEVQQSASGCNIDVMPSSSTNHMHSRMEVYAHRLAQVESRENSVQDISGKQSEMDEEHKLIASYCASLQSTDSMERKQQQLISPLQMMISVEADQKVEFEDMIKELENENKRLQAEYESLCVQIDCQHPDNLSNYNGEDGSDLMAEARLLRQHKGRLEARMQVLEEHNTQLEAQLRRLHQLFSHQSPNSSNSLSKLRGSNTMLSSSSQNSLPNTPNRRLATSSRFSYTDPREIRYRDSSIERSDTDAELDDNYRYSSPIRKDSLSSLLQMANQVGKAVGTLVHVMTDDENDDDEKSNIDENLTEKDKNGNGGNLK